MINTTKKTLLAAALVAAGAAWPLTAGAETMAQDSNKPNIVFIMTDDMGYRDIGVMGADFPTPNIDRLAKQGTSFTDAYITGPICAPSRAGVILGRHQARLGIYTNESVYFHLGQKRIAAEKSIAEYLKEQGYATALYGKWHLCGNKLDHQVPGAVPEANGFDDVEMIRGGMDSFWAGTPLYTEGGKIIKAPEYLTDHFGKLTVDFIQRNAAPESGDPTPFFVALWFNGPHNPLHALDEDIAAFGPLDGYDREFYRGYRQETSAETAAMDRQIYKGMMRAIDRNVGRVLDALEEAGVADNTIVAFVSDNGGPVRDQDRFTDPACAEAQRLTDKEAAFYRDVDRHSYNMADNGELNGGKFDLLEGGIRVPMILTWPGHVPAGKTYDGLTSALDLSATFLAAAGVTRTDKPLDGVNLIPYLDGEKSGPPHEWLAWASSWFPYPDAALRSGDWKIIQRRYDPPGVTDGGWELYNLADDPGETNNLAAQYPERVGELAARYKTWKKEMAGWMGLPKAWRRISAEKSQ